MPAFELSTVILKHPDILENFKFCLLCNFSTDFINVDIENKKSRMQLFDKCGGFWDINKF